MVEWSGRDAPISSGLGGPTFMACKIPVRKTLANVVGAVPQDRPWETASLGPGDACWSSNPGVCHVPQKRNNLSARSGRSPFAQVAGSQLGSARGERTPAEAQSRLWSGAAQITAWVERELQTLSQAGPVPQQDRVRILTEAFGRATELLPEYRPLFYSYQREVDDFIDKLQEQVRDLLNAEGRLKTTKMETIAFVGESTLRFQEEVRCLRKSLEECQKSRDQLAQEKATMQGNFTNMKHRSDRDKWLAEESHKQNLDILSNLERSEKQVEALRKQERESYGEIAKLQHQVKEQDQRNKMVEAQLNAERLKHTSLVPREEHEALKEQLQAARHRCLELEEMHAAKEKDYQNIVEAYKSVSGHGHDTSGVEARPLTPRPIWTACRGLLDPESLRSMQQGDLLQDLVVRIMYSSRTLLAAYGLQAASQKSTVLGKFARHTLTMPLVVETSGSTADRLKTPQDASTAPDAWNEQAIGSAGVDKNDSFKEDEKWLPPDMEATTPMLLRHQEKVRHQRFSRKKTLDFLERVLQLRMREGDNVLSRPYLETMMEVLNQELGEEGSCFGINIPASVRRYAAEPDFLSFLLLLRGHVSDLVVRDNRTLCPEILRIFRTYFESDGSTRVSKEKFFKALREVLPHKEKEHCQELVTYFPPGGPTTLVNYEWLLLDDPYVLSPIVYALRLQHLEESLSLSERMEKMVRSCVKEGGLVKLENMEAACKDDSVLAFLQPEDFARAFQTQLEDLAPGVEQKSSELADLLKNCGIFHELYFPALPEDDGALGESMEDTTGEIQDVAM